MTKRASGPVGADDCCWAKAQAPRSASAAYPSLLDPRDRGSATRSSSGFCLAWEAVAARGPCDVVPSRTPAAATRFGKRLLKTNLDHAQLAVVACLTVLASAPRSGGREQAAAVDRATVSPHRRCADLATSRARPDSA